MARRVSRKERSIIRKANKKYWYNAIKPKHAQSSLVFADKPKKIYPLGRPGRLTNESDKEYKKSQQDYDYFTYIACPRCNTVWSKKLIICEKCGTELHKPVCKEDIILNIIESAKQKGVVSNAWEVFPERKRVSRKIRGI